MKTINVNGQEIIMNDSNVYMSQMLDFGDRDELVHTTGRVRTIFEAITDDTRYISFFNVRLIGDVRLTVICFLDINKNVIDIKQVEDETFVGYLKEKFDYTVEPMQPLVDNSEYKEVFTDLESIDLKGLERNGVSLEKGDSFYVTITDENREKVIPQAFLGFPIKKVKVIIKSDDNNSKRMGELSYLLTNDELMTMTSWYHFMNGFSLETYPTLEAYLEEQKDLVTIQFAKAMNDMFFGWGRIKDKDRYNEVMDLISRRYEEDYHNSLERKRSEYNKPYIDYLTKRHIDNYIKLSLA